MLRLLVLLIVCFALLRWRWTAIRDWIGQAGRRRVGMAAWLGGVLVALGCAWTTERGNWGWPVLVLAAVVALLILYAPPPIRRAGAAGLTLLGAAGIVLALSEKLRGQDVAAQPSSAFAKPGFASAAAKPAAASAAAKAAAASAAAKAAAASAAAKAAAASAAAKAAAAKAAAAPVGAALAVAKPRVPRIATVPALPPELLGRGQAWLLVLLIQSVAMLAAGLWLLWARSHRAALARGGPGAPPAGWARSRGQALLFPLAGATLLLLVGHAANHQAWIGAFVAIAVALFVAWLFPTLGADLATLAVVALALWGMAFATAPPVPWMSGVPGGQVNLGADWRLTMVAAVEAGTLLAFAVWLVPRTIVPHARTVLRLDPDPELAGRVQQLTRTRADAVDTAAAELRRVERDLHDGAQARLVALGMNLRAAERLITTSPEAAIALVAEARETSSRALTELRDLVRGIYPPVLADRGLGDAVKALALDTPLRVETDIDLPGRADAPVESACYFAVAEALANAVKHSGARAAHIRVRFTADRPRARHAEGRPVPGALRIEITDNGTGGADPARGTGLHGVERRLATFDGILAVSSPPGGPTMIIMEVPCTLTGRRTGEASG